MADPLERQVNLVALLLNTSEPLTLSQIADAMPEQYPTNDAARRQAFERDKRALRDQGVPLEQQVMSGERAGATGYWIDRDRYALPDLGLTPDETVALATALAAVHVGAADATGALRKLGVASDEGSGAIVASLPAAPQLPALLAANTARAVVGFRYRGEARTVDPWAIVGKDGFWYVIGRDHRSDERRTFRVDRIEGDVAAAPGSFEVPADFDARAVLADPKLMGAGEPVQARVAVDAARAGKVVRELGEGAVLERRGDGRVVVGVAVTNVPAFRSWVLGLLDHAEVLGPPTLRDELASWLRAIAGA